MHVFLCPGGVFWKLQYRMMLNVRVRVGGGILGLRPLLLQKILPVQHGDDLPHRGIPPFVPELDEDKENESKPYGKGQHA